MRWLQGQAEVVVVTNRQGAAFTREECGARTPRIVGFDPGLVLLAQRWADATRGACSKAEKRAGGHRHCHLGNSRVNDVALLKWQLVRMVDA